MDAKQFLAEFGHIASVPEGVQRLRELVFSLASDGKLLADCELLETTHLDKAADFIMGQAPPGSECNTSGNGTIFVKTGEFGELYPVVREWTTKPLKLAKQGDVLICVVGATVGKLNLAIDCAIGRSVAAIRPRDGLNTKYLYFMLMPFTLRLRSGSRGSAQGVIGKAELSAVKLRVPSKNEQSRIVAKVDELMALCDKLEAQQQEQVKLATLSRTAALDALVSARDSDELNKSWARAQSSLSLWAHESQAIHEFRNAIGALAYRGMLTETAVIAASKPTSESLPDLPTGWKWETLENLTEYITSGSRGWKAYMVSTGDTFIRSQDIKQDALIFENRAFVSLPERTEGKRTLVQPDDLLLTITGGNVGKCARVPVLDCKAYVSQHVALIRLKKPEQSEFIHSWMTNTHGGRKFLSRYIYGDKPGLNLSQVASVPVPIPPPEVQKSIVRQLRHYGKLCAQLAAQIENASRVAGAFAAASVATITGIRPEEEEEPLKTPKTELVSRLHLLNSPSTKEQAPLAEILARHHDEMAAGELWQRFGGDIDAFYAQLKLEIAKGWIAEPAVAEMREVEAG